MKNRKSNKGFTLVEIMIVVAIIGLLAAIAIPNFVRARQTSQTNACINNLRQIDGAKQQWALEKGQSGSASATSSDIKPYLGRGGSLASVFCPNDSTRDFATSYDIQIVSTNPICNINGTDHKLAD
jgi:prepilin-type N-terminal cleavage/methylation domain-containing protein